MTDCKWKEIWKIRSFYTYKCHWESDIGLCLSACVLCGHVEIVIIHCKHNSCCKDQIIFAHCWQTWIIVVAEDSFIWKQVNAFELHVNFMNGTYLRDDKCFSKILCIAQLFFTSIWHHFNGVCLVNQASQVFN